MNILDPVTNLAEATVSTGYDASATSIVLSSGGGAKFPQPSSAGAFNLVWFNATDYNNPADDPNVEIVRVTARSTDTLTVTRGQEGITATTKNTVGKTYKMILSFTKDSRDKIENSININIMTAKTSLVDADELKISDSAASNVLKKITWANIKATLLTYLQGIASTLLKDWDGWKYESDTWTYASASTFTISGDKTAEFTKRVKLKWVQTTTKYGVVSSSSYSAGTGLTTVTIMINTDYTIANATITNPFLSLCDNPSGFPDYFNYTPTFTNLSVGNGTLTGRYTTKGKTCFFNWKIIFGTTTSVSGLIIYSLPVTANFSENVEIGMMYAADATGSAYMGFSRIGSTTTAYIIATTVSGSYVIETVTSATVPFTWATSDVLSVNGLYEIA